MDQDNRSPVKGLRSCGAKPLNAWGALGFVAVTLAGCGATSQNQPDDGHEPDGSGASSSRGGSGSGAEANGGRGAVGAAAGSGGQGGINLAGDPQYFRVVRLTNAQWAASVQEVLKLPEPSGLEQNFSAAISGTTDFTNNELVLDVTSRDWQDFQSAAEALAAQVTATDEALAAVYPDTDSLGFIKTVGRRAYRRPLTNAEVDKCTTLFNYGAAMEGDRSAFAKGAEMVVRALLQSPHFLYRTELGADGEPLSGYEAAAKLSLWLRGSTPDEALLDEAESLSDADALVEEATRMLSEPAAMGVMRQFYGEWLHLDRIRSLTKINTPGYEPSLNDELEESSLSFFDKIFSEGRGVQDILTTTRGFVGQQMAPLYGLEPAGSGLVEQELGPERVGYFSHLPFLTLYAHNQDPDSLHRGVVLALDVLCSPLGPPAPVIPPLPELQPGQTSRQRLDTLTGACGTTCHNGLINPLGFAFEHFDGMGQYRNVELNGVDRLAIDSSGSFTFIDGRVDFADHKELMAAMASRPDAHLCYAKKLASFGLQRDIVATDLPWLNELAELSRDSGSTQEMIVRLVGSDAFRTHLGGKP